jgi:hypothetical protein
MKIIYTVFVLLLAVVANGQNPYLTLDYDSLVIYDYGNIAETESNVKQIGNRYLLKSKPQKSVVLTTNEAKAFSTKIGLKSSYGQPAAACFNPHFAALYYKNGIGIASVEICVDCNQLYSSLTLKAQNQYPQKADDGSVYYSGYGMSKEFRKYLKELQMKYHFSNMPDGRTGMD